MDTLVTAAKHVQSREDFLRFISELVRDRRNNGSRWANSDIDSFLEALGAWVRDMEGFYMNEGRNPPVDFDWSVVADMLMAARIYE